MMRVLVLLLLVFAKGYQCADNTGVETYSSIREILEQFINSLRETLPEELPLRDREISGPENEYVKSNATLYNSALGGLKYFTIDIEYTGVIVPVPRRVTIEYERLRYRSDYLSLVELNPDLVPDVNYENQGDLFSIITNTVLDAAVEFSLTPLSLQLTDLSYQVEGVEVDLDGLLGNKQISQLASAILTRYGAQIINGSSDVLTPLITNLINSFLSVSFPRVYTSTAHENVDYSSYTKEELDARAEALRMGLDNIIRSLKATSN